MNMWRRIRADWSTRMSNADRTRVVIAFCFPLGAVLHVLWVWRHGDIMYHGVAPPWAVWFWYSLCVIDFSVCWLLLARPRAGIVAALAVMAYTSFVNLRFFPTFEFQFNYVLIGLLAFTVLVFCSARWIWIRSRWTL